MPGAKSPIRPPHFADARASEVEDLYRRHATWLNGRVRRQLGADLADEAQDLVQEAYVRAVEIERSTPIRHPRALLLRIAGRLTIDHARRARRLSALPDSAAEKIAVPPTQDSDLLLKQTILGLPPRLRDVFVLNRLEGLSYDQIARDLGVSVKTVEARMSKALAICAARLRA